MPGRLPKNPSTVAAAPGQLKRKFVQRQDLYDMLLEQHGKGNEEAYADLLKQIRAKEKGDDTTPGIIDYAAVLSGDAKKQALAQDPLDMGAKPLFHAQAKSTRSDSEIANDVAWTSSATYKKLRKRHAQLNATRQKRADHMRQKGLANVQAIDSDDEEMQATPDEKSTDLTHASAMETLTKAKAEQKPKGETKDETMDLTQPSPMEKQAGAKPKAEKKPKAAKKERVVPMHDISADVEHIKTQQAEVHHLLTVKPDVMDIAAAEDLQTRIKKRAVGLSDRKNDTKRFREGPDDMDAEPTQADIAMGYDSLEDLSDGDLEGLSDMLVDLEDHINKAKVVQSVPTNAPPPNMSSGVTYEPPLPPPVAPAQPLQPTNAPPPNMSSGVTYEPPPPTPVAPAQPLQPSDRTPGNTASVNAAPPVQPNPIDVLPPLDNGHRRIDPLEDGEADVYGFVPPPPPPPPSRDPGHLGDDHLDGQDHGYAYDIASLTTQGVPLTNAIGASLELGSTRAQKRQEGQMRERGDLHALKSEIVCMHTVYDGLISAFRNGGHQHSKRLALEATDLARVRRHHRMMQDRIRTYYQTTELKVGVIVDAASVPQLHAYGGSGGSGGVAGKSMYSITKHGENHFGHVDRGGEQVMRGGLNTKSILHSRMPPSRPENNPRPAKLPIFLHRDDHPHPSVKFPRDALRGIDLSRINLRAK